MYCVLTVSTCLPPGAPTQPNPAPDSVLPASQGHQAGRACIYLGYDRDASVVFDRVPLPLSGQRASRQLAGNCQAPIRGGGGGQGGLAPPPPPSPQNIAPPNSQARIQGRPRGPCPPPPPGDKRALPPPPPLTKSWIRL